MKNIDFLTEYFMFMSVWYIYLIYINYILNGMSTDSSVDFIFIPLAALNYIYLKVLLIKPLNINYAKYASTHL